MNNYNNRIQAQFKYYVLLTVIYASLMITAQAVAYRLIAIGPFLEPGGIFVFPATFVISDIISEVYGPTLARRSIFIALFAQAFYSLLPIVVNAMPHPAGESHAQMNAAYQLIFNRSWLVFLSNLVAVLIGMVLNTQLIAKTKLITRGKYFSIRSFISSAIGEFFLTAIIVAIALVPIEGVFVGFKLFVNMFLFKAIFSIIVIIPASFLVVLFKKLDRVDVYEESVTLNPMKYFLSPQKAIVMDNCKIVPFKKRS